MKTGSPNPIPPARVCLLSLAVPTDFRLLFNNYQSSRNLLICYICWDEIYFRILFLQNLCSINGIWFSEQDNRVFITKKDDCKRWQFVELLLCPTSLSPSLKFNWYKFGRHSFHIHIVSEYFNSFSIYVWSNTNFSAVEVGNRVFSASINAKNNSQCSSRQLTMLK